MSFSVVQNMHAFFSGDELTIPERLVMDYYEQNWEQGAMHCSEEDYDGAEPL